AYAYGGCIIQDMGYYPFSSRFFSDLTHYVRSGDFIVALVRESQDLNEYAFALGALEHYAADIDGHRIATNPAVALLYPRLGRKFGRSVTYWDDPTAHIRTEFGFDVLQVAAGRYAPAQYHSFIGFQVSKPLLERAFVDTYGIELKDIFASLDLALGSYRHSVSAIVPGMTKLAWGLKREALVKEIPGITRRKFLYNISRASYEKDWGTQYAKPGFLGRLMALVLRVTPKVWIFKSLAVRMPTPEVEKLFMASFNATVDRYRGLLSNVTARQPVLENENFDLGEPTRPGKYRGVDEAYAKLVGKLADRKFAGVSPELRRNILDFYKDMKPLVAAGATGKERAELAKLPGQIEELKAVAESRP
ncbi:MAG TPA: zinc dependent phospholipase C family protein, partial [Bryobacteraceae bacterium]|nr:zinc dependent phospholipase C family protein [Bryobacteraceae bacterium]